MEEIFNDALRNKSDKIAEYLHFGDINIKDSQNRSLLHYAALGASNEVASLLIENNIDLNIINSDGESAIFIAVRNKLLGITKLLIKNGAKLDLVNHRGESLISIAVLNSTDQIVDLLLNSFDFDLSVTNLNKENVLFYAMKGHRTELFKKFVEKYPELINCRDVHNANVLQIAIKYNLSEIVHYLLDEKKISLYEIDNEKNNAIMYLAKYGNSYLTSEILKMKPIIEGKNMFNETPLMMSQENSYDTNHLFDMYRNSYDYISYLRTYPIHIAVINRDYDILNYYNYDINKKDIYGNTILELAKIVNDANILKILNQKNSN